MPEAAASTAFYAARPVLSLDGRKQPALDEGLLSLSVHETCEGLFRCEATFGNWGTSGGRIGFLFFDRDVLDFGNEIDVDMGDSEAGGTVFSGAITGLEGRFPQQSPPEITVLAEDSFQALRMVRKTRSFERVTIDDLANRIVRDHGLQASVDAGGPQYAVITQVNQSDLAFLRECARRVDAELWLTDGTVNIQSRASRRTNDVNFTFGRRLREFSVTADLAGQRTAVTVSGWDVAQKDGIEHRADDGSLSGELRDDESGQSILSSAFEDRPERIVHEVPLDNEEARALAESAFRRQARRFLTGHAQTEGDGRVRAGTHVELDGLGPLFDGTYYVTEVTHTFDLQRGYRTLFRVERAGLGRA